MSYKTQVKITVKVDGRKVAQRKLEANVASVRDGEELLRGANEAAFGIAKELRAQAGV